MTTQTTTARRYNITRRLQGHVDRGYLEAYFGELAPGGVTFTQPIGNISAMGVQTPVLFQNVDEGIVYLMTRDRRHLNNTSEASEGPLLFAETVTLERIADCRIGAQPSKIPANQIGNRILLADEMADGRMIAEYAELKPDMMTDGRIFGRFTWHRLGTRFELEKDPLFKDLFAYVFEGAGIPVAKSTVPFGRPLVSLYFP